MTSLVDRDLRIDAVRGYALLGIFVTHLAYLCGNPILRQVSLGSLALCDTANVFFFISGYMAGLVNGRRLERTGLRATRRHVFGRARRLYVWHLGALAAAVILVGLLTVLGLDLAERSRLAPVFSGSLAVIPAALSLAYTPYAYDVLRLYIMFLLILPFWLRLLQEKPRVALALPALIYLIPQIWPALDPVDWPGPRIWFFNPLAWQMQFFLGAGLARRGLPGPARLWQSRWLTVLAACVVFGGIWVRTAAPGFVAGLDFTVPIIHDDLSYGTLPHAGKTDLEPIRLFYFCALAFLFVRVVPGTWSGWHSKGLRPLVLCGRHPLKVYCLGLVLMMVFGTLLVDLGNTTPAVITATAVGLAAQIALAVALEHRRNRAMPPGDLHANIDGTPNRRPSGDPACVPSGPSI